MSTKRALRRADKVLKAFIDNFHNYDTVLKSQAPVRVYTAEAIENLKRAALTVK